MPLRYASARRWLVKGKASNYIQHFKVKPGQKFIIVRRISTWEQCRDKRHAARKLATQERNLRREVEARGGIVIGVVPISPEPVSGREPGWLSKAAAEAERQGATLLAATTDRFIRHSLFNADWKGFRDAQATTDELEDLRYWTFGVPLMTYLDPDASPTECLELLSEWGQAAGDRGGRPRKLPKDDREPGFRARRKAEGLEMIRKLYAKGARIRGIALRVARKCGVSLKTAYAWIKLAIPA